MWMHSKMLVFLLLLSLLGGGPSSAEAGICDRVLGALTQPFKKKPSEIELWRQEYQAGQGSRSNLDQSAYALAKLLTLSAKSLGAPRSVRRGSHALRRGMAGSLKAWLKEGRAPYRKRLLFREELERDRFDTFKYIGLAFGPYALFLLKALYSERFQLKSDLAALSSFLEQIYQRPEEWTKLGISRGDAAGRTLRHLQSLTSDPKVLRDYRWRFGSGVWFGTIAMTLLGVFSALIGSPFLLAALIFSQDQNMKVTPFNSQQFVMEAARGEDLLNPIDKQVALIVDKNLTAETVAGVMPTTYLSTVAQSIGEISLLQLLSKDFQYEVVSSESEFLSAMEKFKDKPLLYILGHGYPGRLKIGGGSMAKQLAARPDLHRKEGTGTVYIACEYGNCYVGQSTRERWMTLTDRLYSAGAGRSAASTAVLNLLDRGAKSKEPAAGPSGTSPAPSTPASPKQPSLYLLFLENFGKHLARNAVGLNLYQAGVELNRKQAPVPAIRYPAVRIYDPEQKQVREIRIPRPSPETKRTWKKFDKIFYDKATTEAEKRDQLRRWSQDFFDQRSSNALKK